MCGLLEGLTD